MPLAAGFRRRRVLFFAEAVTLAHVARPIVLARSLDATVHEAIVACHPGYLRFVADEAFEGRPLAGIGHASFVSRLARGQPVFTADTLRSYVRDDLALIEQIRPDLVVGDFRLSLSVSARLAGVPYATVTNAYWSPFAIEQRLPLPVLPMTRWMPIAVARLLFEAARPVAMRVHCDPLNRVRRDNGLPSLGHDLRRVYTDADHVLYADAPAMFPVPNLPAHHHFVGPLLWSPAPPRSIDWGALPHDRPWVYLALGSSGDPRVLALAIRALAALPVNVLVSTAGAALEALPPANVHVADYVDGAEAARHAGLVVCNGGSMGCQQALAAGVPVIGIAGNMDQFLNMAALEQAGAGVLLRADRVDEDSLRRAAARALPDPRLQAAARQASRPPDAGSVMSFDVLVASIIASGSRPSDPAA